MIKLSTLAGLLVVALTVSGCSTVSGILDILSPDPVPVCDRDSTGVQLNGKTCVKFSDGSYRWE